MKPSTLADLLRRYLHDETTPAETWTVEQWYEARDMPRPPAPGPAEQAAAKARAWRQIQRRTRPRRAGPQPPARWAAAAALLVSLGLGWLGIAHRPPASGQAARPLARQLTLAAAAPGYVLATNATGQACLLPLPDGSTVTLRPGSRLRYPRRFGAAERVVALQGEAFFEVAHDAAHPFRVLTAQLETTVLGTSFWVRAGATTTVQVRTGRVRVQARAGRAASRPAAVVLRPNQQVAYSPAAPALRPGLVPQPALLAPQPLVFSGRPVAEVLGSLEAAYGVPIRYDGAALAGCTVSLAFTTESLFEKLDLLCRTLGATYERQDEAIIFRTGGCQSE